MVHKLRDTVLQTSRKAGALLPKGLTGKLVLLQLLASLVPSVLVAYLCFRSARSTMVEEACSRMAVVQEDRREALQQWLGTVEQSTVLLSRNGDVRESFEWLTGGDEDDDEIPARDDDDDEAMGGGEHQGESVAKIMANLEMVVELFGATHECDDVLFVTKDGEVRFSATQEELKGTNVHKGTYAQSGLPLLCDSVNSKHQAASVDFTPCPPDGELGIFVGAPCFDDEEGGYQGLVAVRMGTEPVDAIMASTVGLGETGRAYVVGSDGRVLSTGRYAPGTVLTQSAPEAATVKAAVGSEDGSGLTQGLVGRKVVAAWGKAGLPEAASTTSDWGVVAEMGLDEAFADVRAMRWSATLIAIAMTMLGIPLAFVIGGTIARPLRQIAEDAARISEGDLTVEVAADGRRDEIGVLSKAFAGMVGSLRSQLEGIGSGANTLATSGDEIAAVVSQVTTAANESATAVAQMTATAEEVKQATEAASTVAKTVATNAEQTAGLSASGREAMQSVIDGMDTIRERMESIAESIVHLGEQSQAIGQITSTVDDLAEQSNLLAVNAAIEAAKAGEQGKGFAVVAEEIRSLAQQSKHATSEVRNILTEIQKASSSAVMTTEQGSKVVAVGVQQAGDAAKTIETLATSVESAAEATTQIAASAREQLVGVDQMVTGMSSLRQASGQNASGMQQLQESVQQLQALGRDLREMVDRYKVGADN